MRTAICLMGPTASGKTDVAIELASRFPLELVSVDSALVYRGMDIGTAKPEPAVLARAPHRLVDIRDPDEAYSAGDFVRDAREAMAEIFAAERIPLLVGGTMMYFRALTGGLADLPAADPALRQRLDAEAAEQGWPALHERLQAVDPPAAGRINRNDSQRIQRALEVFELSGRPLSDWQATDSGPVEDAVRFIKIGLMIEPRSRLHARIEQRLKLMLNNGFLDELKVLREQGLQSDLASMRAVGYRQLWRYLDGLDSLEEASYRALVATRQLAKRQITWLRSEQDLTLFDALEPGLNDAITSYLARELS